MAKGRTFTVTLPNGEVATRTSQSRVYTHAIVATVDHQARIERLRREAAELRQVVEVVTKLIAEDDLAALELVHTSTDGRGRRFYSSRVPGIKVHHSLADYRDAEQWAEWIDRELADLLSFAEQAEADAAKLADGGEPRGYFVAQWSQSAANAHKGLGAQAAGRRETTLRVVEVDQQS